MLRAVALWAVIVTTALFAQNESKNPDSFDIEPPLLIPNRGEEPLATTKPSLAPARGVDLAKLEKDFERAKRSAAGADRLCRIGALSKVEAEQRALRVVRLEFELTSVRLGCAKEEMVEKEKQLALGRVAKKELTEAETTLALAIEAAHSAAAKRDQVELEAAEANVHRQEKLLALGSARKSDVSRAEQKLAELKAQKN
jgi:hypothetical protein